MNLLVLGEALLNKRQANKKERLALARMGISDEETPEVEKELIEQRINYKGWVGCHRATGDPPNRVKNYEALKDKKHLTGINKEGSIRPWGEPADVW